MQGLNRMDFDTFVLALSEIASMNFSGEVGKAAGTGPSYALNSLIQSNLLSLDSIIQ